MALRGLRGAATVAENTKEEIWKTAQQLITEILSQNQIVFDNIGAVIFSSTEDLTAAFPTTGVRQLPNFQFIPLFDTRQLAVENSLPMCVRVLILVDVDKKLDELHHVYLGGAKNLRPDLS